MISPKVIIGVAAGALVVSLMVVAVAVIGGFA
jgi:hypothetical protein